MATSNFKALFWDNDGVLVDTEKLFYAANKQIFEREGIALPLELFRKWFLLENLGAWHFLEEKGYSKADVKMLKAERNEIYAELIESSDVTIPGVKEGIAILASQYTMGIVTSSAKDHFALIHNKTGLLPHFDFILALGDYAESKPSPAPYLTALERAGCAAEHCLVIEDSERGLLAAKAAGLNCWVVPTELTREGDFSLADREFSNLGEVLAALDTKGQ